MRDNFSKRNEIESDVKLSIYNEILKRLKRLKRAIFSNYVTLNNSIFPYIFVLNKIRANMKKYIYVLYALAVILISYQYSGCSSDEINNILTGGEIFGGYSETEAGEMMTLSALCYVAEGNLNAMQVRDSIIIQLRDTNYATHGDWKLCWGPGISASGANLMYMAVDTTADTIRYAICVRGTVWSFPQNIQEDMEVWKMLPFAYGSAGDSAAFGSMLGLDTLLNTTDPVTS